jgi:5-methylcytosine-specific restriction endonuclease McrA
MTKLTRKEVLSYDKGRKRQATVRRHYFKWRSEQTPPIPARCDIPNCRYHTASLEWNGVRLTLVLDHKNGVSGDNRTKNLQLLCPNCNSQQPTHAGRNKGRVEQLEGSFVLVAKDGKRTHMLPADPGSLTLIGGKAGLRTQKTRPNKPMEPTR